MNLGKRETDHAYLRYSVKYLCVSNLNASFRILDCKDKSRLSHTNYSWEGAAGNINVYIVRQLDQTFWRQGVLEYTVLNLYFAFLCEQETVLLTIKMLSVSRITSPHQELFKLFQIWFHRNILNGVQNLCSNFLDSAVVYLKTAALRSLDHHQLDFLHVQVHQYCTALLHGYYCLSLHCCRQVVEDTCLNLVVL